MHFEHQNDSTLHSFEYQRERLQMLFDRSFLDEDKAQLREQYKALRCLELKSQVNFNSVPTSISSIAENITIACDILLTEMDTLLVFCGNDTAPVMSNPRFIAKALLNLISNAYLYGSERLVTVKSVDSDSFVKIEVQSEGHLAPNFKYGNGLTFVHQVCQKSGGNFFIEQDGFTLRSIMLLPKSKHTNVTDAEYDFYNLITDRLSPVYIELFGMEYH